MILTRLEYKNVNWILNIGDLNIKGIDRKTTIDLKQIYDTKAELYKYYQPINELSSSIEVISYIHEEVSHLEIIADTEFEYVGFDHNQTNYLLPDRSTYIRRYFLHNPDGHADRQYSGVMYGIKFKYRPKPSIYVLNESGEISPDELLDKKTMEKLRTICQKLLLEGDKSLSEKLYAEIRGKGCSHLAACRALYPIHKTKTFRKKRNVSSEMSTTKPINFGCNENTLDSAYRDYQDNWERGELEPSNEENIKQLRHRHPSAKK